MPRGRKDSKAEGAQMDSLYNSDDFRMYCFKVLPCSKHYCHDWTECPFAHPGEKARRRDPRVFPHVGIECPQGASCPRGDLCPFAHNVFECWLHPTRYRTQLCNEPASCRRKVCFFAHTVEELREPTGGMEQVVDPATGAAVAAAANLTPSVNIDQQAAAAASAAAAANATSLVDVAPSVTAPANGTTMPPRPSRTSIDSVGTWRSNKSKASAKEGGQETQGGGTAAMKRTSMDSNRSAKQGSRMSADAPRNGQRSQSASFDAKKVKSKGPGRLSVDIPRMARQQKQQEQESASATAAQLQNLRNEFQAQQLGVSTADLSAALEQLSLTNLSADQIPPQQIQQLQQQALQGQSAGANLTQNDRVVQLFMMLLKEITDSRSAQTQPTDFQAQRTSLDSSFSVGSGVPSERFSLDGFVPMPYNMHYSGGLADAARNLYMPAPGGRVSVDGVPDFILHDSRPRDPSLDSTLSDTMAVQNIARMSIDSGYESSVVSGGSSEQRCLSVDGGVAALNMGTHPHLNASSFVDAFARPTTAPLVTTAAVGTASLNGYPGVSFPQGVTAPLYTPEFNSAGKTS